MLLHVQAIKEVFDDENEVGLASEAKLNESETVIVKPNFMYYNSTYMYFIFITLKIVIHLL